MDGGRTPLDPPGCCICSEGFQRGLKGAGDRRRNPLPLILKCTHSACNYCIIGRVRSTKPVVCSVCRAESRLPDGFREDDIQSVFPLNSYLIGLWSKWRKDIYDGDDSQVSFATKAVKKEPKKGSATCNECAAAASSFCDSCHVMFCAHCFYKVHSAAKVLRDHKSVPLVHDAIPKISNMCSAHPSRKLEFFCTKCEVSICTHCLISDHNQHNLQSLYEKNRECLSEIREVYVDLVHSADLLKASIKKAKHAMLCTLKTPSSSHESRLREHFSQLHARLLLMENDLFNRLHSTSRANTLQYVIAQTEENLETIKLAISKTKTIARYENGDFESLLREIRELVALPNVLVPVENGSAKITLNINTNVIFKELEEHITLRAEDAAAFELKNQAELSEEDLKAFAGVTKRLTAEEVVQDLGPTPKMTCQKQNQKPSVPTGAEALAEAALFEESALSRSSSRDSVHSLSSSSSFTLESTALLVPPEEIVSDMTVSVEVCHFTSPSEFYVQRTAGLVKLKYFQRELRRYAKSNYFFKNKKISYQPGELYMVLYHADGNWTRCQILSFIDKEQMKVVYVDFGNTDIVNKRDLKPLPSAIAKSPPVAYRCSLDNCEPVEGTKWTNEPIVMMSRILNLVGSTTMTVMSKNNASVLTVRLVKENDTAPIDVGEALVYLGLAKHNLETPPPSKSMEKNLQLHPKPYHAQPKLTRDHLQGSNIMISHVESPSEFYAVIPRGAFSSQRAKLQEYTKTERGCDARIVFHPIVGLGVVALSDDGNFERATITEVLPDYIVEVFFVDSGKTSVVEWSNLQTIGSRSLVLPPQAYKCSLADIAPIEGEVWSEPASELLRSFIQKPLKFSHPNLVGDTWSIVLLQPSNADNVICVNAMLVNKQLAKSTGPYGELVERPGSPIEPPVGPRKKNVPKAAAKHGTMLLDESGSKAVKGLDGFYRLKITIVKFVDPGKFFVTIDGYEKAFNSLAEEMNEFYDSEDAAGLSQNEWTDGELCAIKFNGQWMRGVMVGEPDEDRNLLVKLNDDIEEIKVPIAVRGTLKPLDSRFRCLSERVIECCLGGIVPAGSTSWTATSIEVTKEEIRRHKDKLYIRLMKQHHPDSTVLPVEVFLRKKLEPTAITPEKDVWVSWNHTLRMNGLAKPDEFTKWNSEGKREYIGTDHKNIMEDENEELWSMLKARFHITKEGEIDLSKPRAMANELKVSWLPPRSLETFSFTAKPTFVGSDCEVFLQDVKISSIALQVINEEVTKLCHDTLPPDPPIAWENGDICLARFHLDEKWYRGEILNNEVGLGALLVRFVDYGNEEYVLPEDLRTTHGITMRPLQCYKCFFDDLAPHGAMWEKSDIEKIHRLIVDKQCEVKLRILRNGLIGIEKMILDNGKNAVDEIISLGMGDRLADWDRYMYAKSPAAPEPAKLPAAPEPAKPPAALEPAKPPAAPEPEPAVEENEEMKNEENEENESVKEVAEDSLKRLWPMMYEKNGCYELPEEDFRLLEIPEDIFRVKVEIPAVLSPDVFLMQIVESDHPELDAVFKSFEGLVNTMKTDCDSQPPLEPPYLWKACCCKFDGDDIWYRGIVIGGGSSDIDGTVCVQYIDYGDVAVVNANQVKQLNKDWLDVPVRSLPCQIEGYKYSGSIPPREAMLLLLECFQNEEMWAVIKKREKNLFVELQTPAGDLVYQGLIDEKLLIPLSD